MKPEAGCIVSWTWDGQDRVLEPWEAKNFHNSTFLYADYTSEFATLTVSPTRDGRGWYVESFKDPETGQWVPEASIVQDGPHDFRLVFDRQNLTLELAEIHY